MWRKILLKKYNLGNDGWWVSGHGYKASGIWKSILSVKDYFVPLVRYRAHNGRKSGRLAQFLYSSISTKGVGFLLDSEVT